MIPIAHFFGYAHRTEFHSPCHDVKTLLQHYHWNHVYGKKFTTNCPETGIVILLQSRPDEFSPSIIADYTRQNPITPIVLIAGACAESEPRTGDTPIGCYRILASQWNSEFLHEMELMLRKKPSLITLPATVENDERILLQNPPGKSTVDYDGSSDRIRQWRGDKTLPLVAGFRREILHTKSGCALRFRPPTSTALCGGVLSHNGPFGNDHVMNRYLTDLYTKKEIGNTPTRKILADVDDSPLPKILKAVQRLRADFADAEIELYINSPRINEINDLLEAGADKILPKPVFW